VNEYRVTSSDLYGIQERLARLYHLTSNRDIDRTECQGELASLMHDVLILANQMHADEGTAAR
jgi:hypothetical protein